MRTVGNYTLHQTLTTEATKTVNLAVSLARRRGHAQVTPLHVASAMLSSSTCLLRKACLQSHSHPLQCKALELCFNVALNRLPASSSSPLMGPQSHHPCLSNALVAAFKRAQAHQRRGSIENQQQPILALKVELEQLIISILDDPSVSRVMREAGFSSTQVKTNVQQAVSLEISSSSYSSKEISKPSVFSTRTSVSQFPLKNPSDQVENDDVMSVVDTLMNKKRKNSVIVGECLASAEGVFKRVMDKVERGDVPRELRYVQFISLPLFSLKNLNKEVVEERVGELWSLVKSYVSRGVVLFLGDLKWVSEFRSKYGGERMRNYYCPVEHMIVELSRLMCAIGESGRLWLMGVATFKTYMRCRTGQPSLETLWELHPLTIPVGSLGLTLNLESEMEDQVRSKESRDGLRRSLLVAEVEKQLSCCVDCSVNFKREAQSIESTNNHESITTSTSSSLPSWLQQYKEERRSHSTTNYQECDKIRDLCEKWNAICSSVHKNTNFLGKSHNISSSPTSSTSISSYEQHSPKLHKNLVTWPLIFEPKTSPKEHQFLVSETGNDSFDPNFKIYMPNTSSKPDLLSNPNSSPNSASSSEVMEDLVFLSRFKEANTENLNILCNALEKKVPWQRDIIPEIASTILQCRSKTMKRKSESKYIEVDREETWLFFLGVDFDGKENIAKELAKIVFGSHSKFVNIGLSNFSTTRADSTEEISNKRARDELGSSYLERFGEAVMENPSRVFFMEDIEQVDCFSQMGIKKAIESGRIKLPGGELVSLRDAIVIFVCESFSSISRACSPPVRQKSGENEDREEDDTTTPMDSLDLNVATEDDNGNEHSVGDIGILDAVDKQVIFKLPSVMM